MLGGCLLAVPFFKGFSEDQRYMSVDTSRLNSVEQLLLDSPCVSAERVPESAVENASCNATDMVATVEPAPSDWPIWAKKPSLLDELLATKSGDAEHQDRPIARRPQQFRVWTDTTFHEVPNSSLQAQQQSSPFSEQQEHLLQQTTNGSASTTWPDEDPRTEVAIAVPTRPVGHDAMIRDATKRDTRLHDAIVHDAIVRSNASGVKQGRSENSSSAILSAAKTYEPAAHDLADQQQNPLFAADRGAIEFGKSAGKSDPRRIGAALRSQVPPPDFLYIRQPTK